MQNAARGKEPPLVETPSYGLAYDIFSANVSLKAGFPNNDYFNPAETTQTQHRLQTKNADSRFFLVPLSGDGSQFKSAFFCLLKFPNLY